MQMEYRKNTRNPLFTTGKSSQWRKSVVRNSEHRLPIGTTEVGLWAGPQRPT